MLTLCAQFSHRFAASEVWNLLFPRGTWHGENLRPIGGSITIDDAMLGEMVANWRGAGSPPLPVYKTHAHLEDGVSALERAELSKAYGYLTDFRITADGLEAKTEWTAAGKAMVDAGEFAFWSPEWQPKHRDRRTGDVKGWWLSGTALCSNPFFHEMPPVAASAHAEEQSTEPTHTKEQHMTKEQLEALRASLGLAADATVEQILKASAERGAEIATLKAEATKLKASTPAAEVITAAVAPIKAQVDTLTAELAKRDAALLERDVNDAVTKAKRGDGKTGRTITEKLVAHAMRVAKSDGLAAAVDFLEAIPATVPVQAIGVDTKDEGALSASAANEKLTIIANELESKGVKAPMEVALASNPELARIARSLTTNR